MNLTEFEHLYFINSIYQQLQDVWFSGAQHFPSWGSHFKWSVQKHGMHVTSVNIALSCSVGEHPGPSVSAIAVSKLAIFNDPDRELPHTEIQTFTINIPMHMVIKKNFAIFI